MMPRTLFLNGLILQNRYTSYLEIGVDDSVNFNGIIIEKKVGCDPNSDRGTPTHLMTSDEFFSQNEFFFDIVFVDGLHYFDQSYLDVVNSFKWLTPDGMVVMHDTYPRDYGSQRVPVMQAAWSGDVWKTILKIQIHNREWDVKTYDIESGISVIQRTDPPRPVSSFQETYYYEYIEKNAPEILNLQK